MEEFRKINQQKLALDVVIAKINPVMDIVALAFRTCDILINRIYTWQKIHHIFSPRFRNINKQKSSIVDMVWSNNGKLIAVAYNLPFRKNDNEGSISSFAVYSLDLKIMVCSYNLNYDVSCLFWQSKLFGKKQLNEFVTTLINVDDEKFPKDSKNIPFVDLFAFDDNLLNYPFENTSKKSNEHDQYSAGKKLPQLSKFFLKEKCSSFDKMNLLEDKSISILTVGTKQDVVLFYLYGFFQIMQINISEFVDLKKDYFPINRVWLSPDFKYLQVLVDKSNLFICEIKLLDKLWKQIYIMHTIFYNINIRMKFIYYKLKTISFSWSDIMIDLDSRTCNYAIFVSKDDLVGEHDQKQLKPSDFVDIIIFGFINKNLEDFLSNLKKSEIPNIYSSFKQSIDEICQTIVTDIFYTLTQILLYIENLRGIILNDVQFFHMGIKVEDLNIFRLEVSIMMDKCNKLMIMLNEFKSKMLSFTRLIYKGVLMLQSVNQKNDFENSKTIEDPSIGKFSYQDFHIVMDLLNTDTFLNGFNLNEIGAILRSSKISEAICKSRLEKHLPLNNKNNNNENDEDNSKNPYKTYMAEIRLERFIEILNKNVDRLNDMDEDELMRIFFSPTELNIQNLNEDDPDETRKWFRMLVNDYANIDQIDEDIYKYMSFFDHFTHLGQIKKKLLNCFPVHMSNCEMELFNETRDYFTFKINDDNDDEEIDYVKLAENYRSMHPGCTKNIENIDLSYLKRFDDNQFSIDCFNFIKNYKSKNLFICKYFKSLPLIALFNFKQKYKTVSLLEFNIVAECFCEKPCTIIQFQVNDCQFYNYEYLTLIMKENHSNINHESKAYLIQFNYRSLFDKCSENIFIRSNYCPTLDNCLTINITNKLKQIYGANLNDDSFNEFESLIKIRLLGSNDQTYLSINGNRNLVYCIDRLRTCLTSWEMDANDENEDDEEMDDKQNDSENEIENNDNDNECKNVNGNENNDITENENDDPNEMENGIGSETEIETETETETENENEIKNGTEIEDETENENDYERNKLREKEKEKKLGKKKIDLDGWLPPYWNKELIKKVFNLSEDEIEPPRIRTAFGYDFTKNMDDEDFSIDDLPAV